MTLESRLLHGNDGWTHFHQNLILISDTGLTQEGIRSFLRFLEKKRMNRMDFYYKKG